MPASTKVAGMRSDRYLSWSEASAPAGAAAATEPLIQASSRKVGKAMHERKKGTLKSGSGRKVKSKKQAIAIGLSEARKEGKKVPKKKSSK